MNTWLADYHHLLLVRLVLLFFAFGVIWPCLWLVGAIGVRTTLVGLQIRSRGPRRGGATERAFQASPQALRRRPW